MCVAMDDRTCGSLLLASSSLPAARSGIEDCLSSFRMDRPLPIILGLQSLEHCDRGQNVRSLVLHFISFPYPLLFASTTVDASIPCRRDENLKTTRPPITLYAATEGAQRFVVALGSRPPSTHPNGLPEHVRCLWPM